MENKNLNLQPQEKKDFKFPISQAVKNAFTGASVEGFNPDTKMIDVRMADSSYHKLKVSEQSAGFLSQAKDMPKLQIKDIKNQSFELGKTFIELAPDAVKFLNSKYQEKNVPIPEILKINKAEIQLTPAQRKDLGSGMPVNVGPIGEAKDKKNTILMLNPNVPGKLMVMKETGTGINILDKPTPNREQKDTDTTVSKAEPRKMREEHVAKGQHV